MPTCEVCRKEKPCQIGFSVSDRYCPLCGLRLRRLSSPLGCHERDANENEITWLYPTDRDDGRRYLLPLCMQYADGRGQLQVGQPVRASHGLPLSGSLKIDQDSFPIEDVREADGTTVCWLPVPPGQQIGSSGLAGEVKLKSGFGEETLRIRLCNVPRLEYEIEPHPFLHVADTANKTYVFWKRGKFQVSLALQAAEAPVLLAGSVAVEQSDVGLNLIESAPWSDVRLDKKRTLALQVATESWNDQEEHRLLLRIPCRDCPVLPEGRVSLAFRLADVGDLGLEPPRIDVQSLSWGEKLDSQLTVTNTGHQPLGRLTVTSTPAWLQFACRDSTPPGNLDSLADLAGGASRTIRVTLDMTQLPTLPKDRQGLRGAIRFEEEKPAPGGTRTRTWELAVNIDYVSLPAAVPVVAVDLGSNNTCVAYWDARQRKPVLIPLGDPVAGEVATTIPSAIFFQKVRPRHSPRYVVGHLALQFAGLSISDEQVLTVPDSRRLLSLVQDFKRWIGCARTIRIYQAAQGTDRYGAEGGLMDASQSGGAGQRHGPSDSPETLGYEDYPPEDLMQLLLRDVVFRVLRQRLPTSIELTFPTKFTRGQWGAYEGICLRLRDELTNRQIGVNLAERPSLDEASAAAISLLYGDLDDPKDRPDKDHFLLAAVDWGGGTFDSCLMELHRTDRNDRGQGDGQESDRGHRYEVSHRGFAGDPHLGGNDVTNAGVQFLHGRLVESLGRLCHEKQLPTPLLPLDWPGIPSSTASTGGQANHQLLWYVVERLKRRLSDRVQQQGYPEDLTGIRAEMIADKDLWNGVRQCLCQLIVQNADAASSPPPDLVASFVSTPTTASNSPTGGHSDAWRPTASGTDKLSSVPDVEQSLGLPLVDQFLDEVKQLSLASLCGAPLPGRIGQSVQELLQEQIKRLEQQVSFTKELGGLTLDYLLLAGSGSRFPLLEHLLRERFPQTRLIVNPQLAKERVAFGLALYANMKRTGGLFRGFPRACDVTPDWYGVVRVRDRNLVHNWVIPAGSLWQPHAGGERFAFRLRGDQVMCESRPTISPSGKASILRRWFPLYNVTTGAEVGIFDLDETSSRGTDLPRNLAQDAEYDAWFTLWGERRIQLQVQVGDAQCGPFELIWIEDETQL